MQRDARQRKRDDNGRDSERPVHSITIDDLASVGDAIIAGVTAAQLTNNVENNASNDGETNNSSTVTSRRTAPAGSVGSFISNRRRNAHTQQNDNNNS